MVIKTLFDIRKSIKRYRKRKERRTKDEEIWTFTKSWMHRLLWFFCLWITWSYALATFAAINGTYTIVENLSRSVCTSLMTVMLGYLGKSFFETYSERKNELVKNKLDKYTKTKNNITESLSEDYTEESECYSSTSDDSVG